MDAGSGAAGCLVRCVELDFETKAISACDPARARQAMAEGRFVWLDANYTAAGAMREVLRSLGVLTEPILDEIFAREPGTQLSRYPECLHLVASGCRLDSQGHLTLERVDAIVAERCFITVHEGPRIFLDAVARQYESDFVRFAKSPSFLVYEFWDELIEHYVSIQKSLEKRVETLQADLFSSADDEVFARVSDIGADLLHFRSVLMPARTVLTEISTRKSIFVSEATQGFLANMVGTLERVLQDVLVDRDILAQSLNLHVSMVSHRTNSAMSKLTVISTIFLPLTFLCGVYGMNFAYLPELQWEYGYPLFWVAVGSIIFGIVTVMRRNKLL